MSRDSCERCPELTYPLAHSVLADPGVGARRSKGRRLPNFYRRVATVSAEGPRPRGRSLLCVQSALTALSFCVLSPGVRLIGVG